MRRHHIVVDTAHSGAQEAPLVGPPPEIERSERDHPPFFGAADVRGDAQIERRSRAAVARLDVGVEAEEAGAKALPRPNRAIAPALVPRIDPAPLRVVAGRG